MLCISLLKNGEFSGVFPSFPGFFPSPPARGGSNVFSEAFTGRGTATGASMRRRISTIAMPRCGEDWEVGFERKTTPGRLITWNLKKIFPFKTIPKGSSLSRVQTTCGSQVGFFWMVKNLQQDGQAPEWFHPSYWVPLGWMLLRICKVVIGQDLRPRPGKVPEGSAGRSSR